MGPDCFEEIKRIQSECRARTFFFCSGGQELWGGVTSSGGGVHYGGFVARAVPMKIKKKHTPPSSLPSDRREVVFHSLLRGCFLGEK